MAGYSSRTLIQKLGIARGMTVVVQGPPDNYLQLLGRIPENVIITSDVSVPVSFIHFFAKSKQELTEFLRELIPYLKKDGVLWISWPKKTAASSGDLSENFIREQGLLLGLVDIKVCAIDETWSGLKFMYRRTNRT